MLNLSLNSYYDKTKQNKNPLPHETAHSIWGKWSPLKRSFLKWALTDLSMISARWSNICLLNTPRINPFSTMNQRSAKYGLQAKCSPPIILVNKVYWNTAKSIHLCIVYGCFCSKTEMLEQKTFGPQSQKYLLFDPWEGIWPLLYMTGLETLKKD